MIEKNINYIWLGNSKDKVSCICINTWYQNLEGYKIIEWNENNLDLKKLEDNSLFLRKCLKYKLWAFASDYIRFWLLYNYGGIYLDADVQVLKNFNNFLKYDFFCGYEEFDFIGSGIIGAKKGSKIIKKILDFYDKEIWEENIYTSPEIITYIYKKYPELFENSYVAEQMFFSPLSYSKYSIPIKSDNSITIHWYTAKWNLRFKGECFLRTKHVKGLVKKSLIVLRILVRRIIKKR